MAYSQHPSYQSQTYVSPGARQYMLEQEQQNFTPAQIQKYKQVFDMFDINKNGVVEAGELTAVSQVLGYRLPPQQVQDILSHFNLGPNGSLTFQDFLQTMSGKVQVIPEEEHRRAEIRRMFQAFDKDGNGYITKEEAHQVLSRELGFKQEQTLAFLNQFDINCDGKLSYEEFVGFYLKVKDRKDAIDKAFRQFDRDNKGFVSMADAKRILTGPGMLFSEYEVERLVKAHDTNGDGRLQYDEFMHFWTV